MTSLRNESTLYCSRLINTQIAFIALVYVLQAVSWTLGFGIALAALVVAMIIFVIPYRSYVKLPSNGSPLTRVYLTLRAAWLKRKAPLHDDPKELFELDGPDSAIPDCPKLPYSSGLRCVDRAAIRKEECQEKLLLPDWVHSITVTHCQEVKILCSLIPIMATTMIYQMVNGVMLTLFISQGWFRLDVLWPHSDYVFYIVLLH